MDALSPAAANYLPGAASHPLTLMEPRVGDLSEADRLRPVHELRNDIHHLKEHTDAVSHHILSVCAENDEKTEANK